MESSAETKPAAAESCRSHALQGGELESGSLAAPQLLQLMLSDKLPKNLPGSCLKIELLASSRQKRQPLAGRLTGRATKQPGPLGWMRRTQDRFEEK